MELLAVDIDRGEVEMERKRERGRQQEVLWRSFYWDRQIYFFAIYVWFAI